MDKKINYIITFLLLICFIICLFMPRTYAAEFELSEEVKNTIQQKYYGYIICNFGGENYVYIIASDDKSILQKTGNELIEVRNSGQGDQAFYLKKANSDYYLYTHKMVYDNGVPTFNISSGSLKIATNSADVGRMFRSIMFSTFDLYTADGSLFFQGTPLVIPKTLAEETMEMIAEETPKTAEEIQATTMRIVIIAVSCLALLISLVILLKVLRTYLAH